MKQLLYLLAGWWPQSPRVRSTRPKPLQWVRLVQYQLQYRVPASWTSVRHATPTNLIITYFNADKTLKFSAGKVWGAAASTTPAQALAHMAEQFEVALGHPTATAYRHLHFLEAKGTSHLNGQLRCCRALAAHHRGHVLLMYVSGQPEAFLAHQHEVELVLHSMAPYQE